MYTPGAKANDAYSVPETGEAADEVAIIIVDVT